jgi:predicted phosphate transport protein (TIGR00153 family)
MAKRFDYFGAFIDFSKKACTAAETLDNFFKNFSADNIQSEMDKIHTIEHEADSIKHDVINNLIREFVPPLEREDILELVAEFDNVVDSIDEVIREVAMFRVTALRPDVIAFTELLVEMCRKLNTVCTEFVNYKKSANLKDLLIDINRIESDADTVHWNAVTTLFGECDDAKQIIIWRSIYDTLESCFDSGEHTADVVEGVILKNT